MGCKNCVRLLRRIASLEYLDVLSPVENLTVKELTLKPCMLLSLVTGQRGHALYSLSVNDVKMEENKRVLFFSQKLKTTRPGSHPEPAEIRTFPDNIKLCPIAHLKHYLSRTEKLGKCNQLFMSYTKPHLPVGKQTFSRWIKSVFASAGTDTDIYSVHSTKAESTSTAASAGVSLKVILKAAGWSGEHIFHKFYR